MKCNVCVYSLQQKLFELQSFIDEKEIGSGRNKGNGREEEAENESER